MQRNGEAADRVTGSVARDQIAEEGDFAERVVVVRRQVGAVVEHGRAIGGDQVVPAGPGGGPRVVVHFDGEPVRGRHRRSGHGENVTLKGRSDDYSDFQIAQSHCCPKIPR